MKLKIKRTGYNTNLLLPEYQTIGAAGFDLQANVNALLSNHKAVAIGTGLCFEIPEGYELQIRSRSGLALKRGIFVVNAPGTIDSDYRGEMKVILVNLSNETQIIEPSERIAQLVIAEYVRADWQQVEVLSETKRGAGGFGSTGVK